MADLHKFTVQEALNASQGSAGGWSVATRQTVNASSGATIHFALDASTTILMLQPSVDTEFSFTTAEADVVANDDLYIPGGILTSLIVPRGLGGTIILNFVALGGTAGTMKVVEV